MMSTESRHQLPFFALLLSFLIVLFFWNGARRTVESKAEARFQTEVRDISRLIQQRLDLYMDVLHGAQGFHAASREVRNFEWRIYARELDIDDRYPGILALRYVRRVSPEQALDFSETVSTDENYRKLGYPTFPFQARARREESYVVLFCEPLAGNQWMFGYDLASHPDLKPLYERVGKTGRLLASGLLDVREGWRLPAAGFLIAAPIYREGVDRSDPESLLRHLTGYIDIVLKADELLRDIYQRAQTQPQVDFEIYDGARADSDRLLYSSVSAPKEHRPRFVTSVSMEVAGRAWTLYFSARPGFGLDTLQENHPAFVLYAGSVVSLLLFGLLYSLSVSRQRAEDLAQEMTREMKKALQVKTEFTSTVSHELRTPLAAIKESVSMVEDGTVGPVNDDQKDMLSTASRNVDRLSRLINAVLDYQKMDSRQAQLVKEPTDLDRLLSDVLKTFGPYASRKGVTLNYHADPGLKGHPVDLDADKITQVLTNLLDNAFKFSDTGAVTVRATLMSDRVRVQVEDEGIGIQEKDVDRLFRGFSQIPREGNRKTGGTGLGLAISKSIVDAHGGSIGVTSKTPQGCVFFFDLPLGPTAGSRRR